MQKELTRPSSLLTPQGDLVQIGWARQAILDTNLEDINVYKWKIIQKYRIKQWDYYAVFSSNSFFSATIADLGYAGNIFVYYLDYSTNYLHEEGIIVPFGKSIKLPRNSTDGVSVFDNGNVKLTFDVRLDQRQVNISWPEFDHGKGITAKICLDCPQDYESMNITIPIKGKRFYYNRKINCLPATGSIQYGNTMTEITPQSSLGSLDWGRGVWEYQSFWNWASTSGFLSDGRTIGLNLGCGFGDLSNASENAIIIDNRIHKLETVKFDYKSADYMHPWVFTESTGRVKLRFTPFKDRTANTNLGIISSSVHQLFGRYDGEVISDSGEVIKIVNLIGFAEEHHARW